MRATFPVAAHLLLIADGKILLQRRRNTGYEDGRLGVPSGHVERGEDVYSAMIREAREEIGVQLLRRGLEIAQVMHRNGDDGGRIDYFFTCGEWKGGITNAEPDKCGELLWCDVCKLPDDVIGYVACAIKNFTLGVKFSIYGW